MYIVTNNYMHIYIQVYFDRLCTESLQSQLLSVVALVGLKLVVSSLKGLIPFTCQTHFVSHPQSCLFFPKLCSLCSFVKLLGEELQTLIPHTVKTNNHSTTHLFLFSVVNAKQSSDNPCLVGQVNWNQSAHTFELKLMICHEFKLCMLYTL